MIGQPLQCDVYVLLILARDAVDSDLTVSKFLYTQASGQRTAAQACARSAG